MCGRSQENLGSCLRPSRDRSGLFGVRNSLKHPIALRLSDAPSISPPAYVSYSGADQRGGYRTSADMRATRPMTLFRQPEADEKSEQTVLDTVPLIPHRFRRAIRRTELRQIVPLADTTIYELEQRGDFP